MPHQAGLIVKEVFVDSAVMLKRLRTAPQGRAYRVRKRSNHVTLFIDYKNNPVQAEVAETEETVAE